MRHDPDCFALVNGERCSCAREERYHWSDSLMRGKDLPILEAWARDLMNQRAVLGYALPHNNVYGTFLVFIPEDADGLPDSPSSVVPITFQRLPRPTP